MKIDLSTTKNMVTTVDTPLKFVTYFFNPSLITILKPRIAFISILVFPPVVIVRE
jgi:hypothetical protein